MALTGIPSQWPRTLSVLGLGSILLLLLSDLANLAKPAEPQTWQALAYLGLEAPSVAAIEVLVFLFASYVAGEAVMLMGMAAQRKSPVHLRRFAVVKFIAVEGNEVWGQHFSEEERKFELFNGLGAAALLMGLSIGIHMLLDGQWLYGTCFVIGGPVVSCGFFSFSRDSYLGFSAIMDAIIEAQPPNTQSQYSENAIGELIGEHTASKETP